MKFIKIEDENDTSLSYPVGANLFQASSYINIVYNRIKDLIPKDKLINVWARGSSGSILGTLLIGKMMDNGISENIKLAYVRKPSETEHRSSPSSFYYSPEVFNIVIDDFIASGRTIKSIFEAMKGENRQQPVDILIVKGAYRLEEMSNKPVINILVSDEKF